MLIIDNIALHPYFWSRYLAGSSLKMAAFPRAGDAGLPIGGTFPRFPLTLPRPHKLQMTR